MERKEKGSVLCAYFHLLREKRVESVKNMTAEDYAGCHALIDS